jgi:hypothetical protein
MNPRLASACRRSLGSQGALALATVLSLPAVAQEAAPPDEPIEVVVVIGTPGGGGPIGRKRALPSRRSNRTRSKKFRRRALPTW